MLVAVHDEPTLKFLPEEMSAITNTMGSFSAAGEGKHLRRAGGWWCSSCMRVQHCLTLQLYSTNRTRQPTAALVLRTLSEVTQSNGDCHLGP